MRFTFQLVSFLMGCRAILALQAPLLTISLPEEKERSLFTNALRDAWPGVANATNAWAMTIRRDAQWTNVSHASMAETIALAEKGSAVAELRLGYSYFAGDGVDQDYVSASGWLAKATESHFAPVDFLLGIAFLNGLGVQQDFEKAVEHLDQAAELGFADAEFQVGLCYLRGGPGVNQAPARGIKWLTRAAEQGKANAQQFLGWCFASGNGVREDPGLAFDWCSRAASQGLETAQDLLGMFWATGYGTNQNWTQAARYFGLAAVQGLGTAQMHLAQCCEMGRGVTKDPAAAFHWWQMAAQQGYSSAQFHTGLSTFEGLGTAKDVEAAVGWFHKAAEQQHVGGQLYLGLCFWKGQGVDVDGDAAQKWWREAAVHGIARGPAELADELSEVERWWQQVAKQGNARIQCCLAEFYRFGQGVARNDAEALKWYRMACETGDVAALQAAAWLLATSPKSELRDGRSAVDLARKAAAATKRKNPKALDTLAAAYAESAQFSKAISAENEAIALAQEDSDKKDYLSRLRLYQAKAPYRAPEQAPSFPQLE